MLYLFYVLFLYIKYQIGFLEFEQFVKSSIDYLAKKNIIFVKLCQWLSFDLCKDKEVARRLVDYLEKFCNHCPFQDSDIDYISYYDVKDTLKLEDKPSFTGSIAICYLGEYEGSKIICKILRKTIKQQIDEFEYFINQIWYIISWIEHLNLISLYENKNFLNDLKEEILNSYINQIDLELECRNIQLFKDTYDNYDNIRVPKIWKSFTEQNNKIIVMEYLEPYKLLNELSNEEKNTYGKILANHIINSFTREFILHSDLHLGNVIFQKEGDKFILRIIDLGVLRIINSLENKNMSLSIFGEIIEHLDIEKRKYFIYCFLKYIEKEKDILGLSNEQILNLNNFYEENKSNNYESFIEMNNFFLHCLKNGIKFPFVITHVMLFFPPILGLGFKLETSVAQNDNMIIDLRKRFIEFYNEY